METRNAEWKKKSEKVKTSGVSSFQGRGDIKKNVGRHLSTGS